MTEPPRTPLHQRRVLAGELSLAVTEFAAPVGAPELILLHGIGSRAVSWWPVVDTLAAEFRLVAPDLRGHGASDKPAAGYLLPDYARDLTGLIDALGLQRPRLLGHSLGGLIALTWAIDHPAVAAAIALEDTSLSGGPRVAPAFDGWLALSRMSVDDAAAYYAKEYPDWSPEDCRRRAESITATAPGVFEELRDQALRAELSDRLAGLTAIRSPVLFMHGDVESGGMVPPDDAARFAATLPAARVVHLPGAGHNIHRDDTDRYLATVVPFLRKPPQDTPSAG